jgi:acyl carrier protein
MSIEAKIRDYILENYLFTDDQSALSNQESFLDKGIIDSTGIMEVIMFLEEEFGISVEDEEMIPENLDSVNNIVAFVNRKQATNS